jgi:copper chaperone CopZ
MSNYIHSIPGRLRIKSTLIKKNPAEAAKAKALLAPLPGIQNVDVNLLTGSVLVRYDPAAIAEGRILWSLSQGVYFEPAKAVTQDDMLHSALTTAGRAVGSLAVGTLEIDSPALAVLAALI